MSSREWSVNIDQKKVTVTSGGEPRVTSSGKLIICSDFNFHWDNQLNSNTNLIADVIQSVNLIHSTLVGQLMKMATHEGDKIVKDCTVSYLITDHHMIHFSLSKPPLPKVVQTCRSYIMCQLIHLLFWQRLGLVI